MDADLRGRVALVVGGSGGIGREVAIRLAARGASLRIHGRRPERVDALLESLSRPHEHRGLAADLSGESGPERLDELLRFADSPDLLVFAYGPETLLPLPELGSKQWVQATLANLVLPGIAVSALLPSMCSRNWGRVVLFGATGTERIRGFRDDPAYGAAKTALASLVRSADLAVDGKDVAVNCVSPGYADTEYRHWGRGLTAGAVADVVSWLCPSGPASVRGAVVPVRSRGVSV